VALVRFHGGFLVSSRMNNLTHSFRSVNAQYLVGHGRKANIPT